MLHSRLRGMGKPVPPPDPAFLERAWSAIAAGIQFHTGLSTLGPMEFKQRVIACFQGLATADAIGKQTEMLSHADVFRWYPQGIRGFCGSPGEVIPRYKGNAKHEWRIGETTDDTEQTIALARAILRDESVFHTSVGRELLECKKSLHPGVKSMWSFKQIGDPSRVAADGDGCGAAMRVAA